MKNKWIYIGIGALLIVVAGVIVFIYFTAPEILTKTPLELIVGRDIQNEANEVNPTLNEVSPPPPPDIPPNFFVSDEIWQSAFLLNRADGTPVSRHVGFDNIPIGTKIYAPMDGYVFYFFGGEGERAYEMAVLAEHRGWSSDRSSGKVRHVEVLAKQVTILKDETKKGEVFAVIEDNAGTPFSGLADREVAVVLGINAWAKASVTDRTITDPKVYLWTAFQQLKNN